MGSVRTRCVVIALAAAGLVLPPATTPVTAEERPYGDAKILAQVPNPPGFPEGIAVDGGKVFVAGPATFGTTGKPPSAVVSFDAATGATAQYYATVGEDTTQEHADSSIAFDGSGLLYVLNTQLGLYRLDPETGVQSSYSAPFPNLAPCAPLVSPPPCSPTVADAPPIPNDVAFDSAGNAFVTDSTQATIWRIAAGGGQPQIWFQDQRLASAYIGVNGIRLDAGEDFAYVTVTADVLGQGSVYRLPLVAEPGAGDLELFHRFAAGDLPDGIAFGETGLLYVAMATPTASGVIILDGDGALVRRLVNSPLSPFAPYDSPANIAFTGDGRILLSNHAFVSGAVVPEQFAIVDVFVDDAGQPLAQPIIA